jgi:hypothetical protein
VIVIDLMCEHEHRFEGWFACSEDVESQQQRGLLVCAVCGSPNMRRLPSAPHVHRSSADQEPDHNRPRPETKSLETTDAPNEAQHLLQLLVKKLRESAAQSEDVGEDFPIEVRRIHFGDAEERNIRGLATAQDVTNLLDEGISVLPIPIPKEDLH